MSRALSQADRSLALVAELAEVIGHAHTEATLRTALSGAFARHLPVLALELLPSEETQRSPRVVSIARATAAEARLPEVRRARELGAETLVVLPLRAGKDGGIAALALGPSTERGPELTPALLDAVARVLTIAGEQVQLLGRVASLSRRAHGEGKQLRQELERAVLPPDVVAASPGMRAIFHELVPLVARQDTTVLVRGETGTGKEVIARRIHALSRRAARPFCAVNCGALPEGLVESALFGHERGAFTGATARHKGFFERADGGTLLLDEVAELPKAAQVKLLRALQTGEIERMGAESTHHVDVRVIAATHRPLESMVAEGTFREDLYYRLDVFPITVPPLRERPEDLEPLVHAILARLAARFGRTPPRVSEEAMARLRARPFPGNVRELENVLERSLVVSTGHELVIAGAQDAGRSTMGALPSTAQVESYRDAMKRCIESALRVAGGKLYGEGGAAAALGLKPTTLQSKMKKLGLSASRRDDS